MKTENEQLSNGVQEKEMWIRWFTMVLDVQTEIVNRDLQAETRTSKRNKLAKKRKKKARNDAKTNQKK